MNKNSILSTLFTLFCAANLTAQTVTFLKDGDNGGSQRALNLGRIELFKEHHFTLRFKNTGSFPLTIYYAHMAYEERNAASNYFSIDYVERSVPVGAIDSLMLTCTPTDGAMHHELLYDLSLIRTGETELDKRKITSFRLHFLTFANLEPKAILGFPNAQKRYNIGQIYCLNGVPPTPLPFYNKGTMPLIVSQFNDKKGANRENLRGKAVPPSEVSFLEFKPKFTKLGHFDDTLYVFCNGLDSIHEVIVSGEMLEPEDGRPILKIDNDNGVIPFGTRVEASDQLLKIVVKNIGTLPLIIRRAGTNDGGSMASWQQEPILPNETGIVEFRYDTRRIGLVNKSLWIETNEPNGIYHYSVKGVVVEKK
jgi:Protein of unknown function (DUF1573)